MHLLIFILIYPLIWLFSLLPMRILYIFSDLFYVIFYYIVGYRKKVVISNIKLAFPEKTDKEVKKIAKKFFSHLCDTIFESIKAFSISEKEILRRYAYKNPEVLNDIAAKGKSIAMIGAHYANWEWSINMPLITKIDCYGAYNTLGNKYFDKAIKKSRQKFGFIGYQTSQTIAKMDEITKSDRNGLYVLLSDQTPKITKTFYWAKFMGIKVPIHTGAEMLAKKFDLAVINYSTRKLKRGYYEAEFTLITETPNDFKDFEITDRYITLTEAAIKESPELYLWSHKRFKHRHKVPAAFQD